MRQWSLLLALAMLLPLAAGCLTYPTTVVQSSGVAGPAYDTSRGWSMPLSPALYGILDAVKEKVPAADGTPLAIGVFLPDMEGCDWAAGNLSAECRLPTVMDAGPYYGPNVDKDKYRPPTIEWLVPRGYAVIQMSLRGTGESGGCLEFKAPQDVEDVSAVISWIAQQPWSNGNVGMTGRSYDGTSAWAGAASGNPHLKTIVPISGAVNGPFLYYKNGTSELRGAINGATYFPTYATDAKPPTEWTERLCEGALVDVHRESAYSSLTGDASSEYWQSRDLRQQILENYNGSVWVIHGLHDWNVNPSQAVPFVRELQAAGIETKAWFGVWEHHYPDRVDEHRNVRWDWAERMVQWFDKYLRGTPGIDTGPAVEVEDNLFVWRGEATYPPADATWLDFEASGDGALAPAGNGTPGSFTLVGGTTAVANQAGPGEAPSLGDLGGLGDSVTFRSEPLARALRFAGLPQFHVTATPSTPVGGHLFAELFDVFPDGRTMRLGWGAISLHHYAGGNGEPETLTPGVPVVARMEFEPMDALVAEGHRLRLVVHRDGVEDILPSPSLEPVELSLGGGASVLRLPLIERPMVLPTYVAPGLAP
ncbi:MAG TPA: CocE/NonD family hydrolase [Candidatus Thermoplasmatota archaeon]|nr:CocE/NonD family hydrolase [Candidatus Thermoplasmatota archaeon]